MKKKTRKTAERVKKAPITALEKEQIRARKRAGHDHLITIDEHGRERITKGMADSKRQMEVAALFVEGGKRQEVARVRNVDPLKGITSLTYHQREAGKKYRELFEAAATIGIKSGSFDERVDGGGQMKAIPVQLLRTLERFDLANDKMGHHEIVGIVQSICGTGMSVKEYATENREMRDVVVRLLKIGLDHLAIYFGVKMPDKKSGKAGIGAAKPRS